uniref:Uncharacterized protein n=1 Tax=Triticum urartu TaxID=4572 RepID=A0A8R7TE28_TRIUA
MEPKAAYDASPSRRPPRYLAAVSVDAGRLCSPVHSTGLLVPARPRDQCRCPCERPRHRRPLLLACATSWWIPGARSHRRRILLHGDRRRPGVVRRSQAGDLASSIVVVLCLPS